jgi:hypothetical protein
VSTPRKFSNDEHQAAREAAELRSDIASDPIRTERLDRASEAIRWGSEFITRTLGEAEITFEDLTSREMELLDAAMISHIQLLRLQRHQRWGDA